MKSLKLLFLGTPAFALPSLEQLSRSGHFLSAVVTPPDRPRGRKGTLQPSPVKRWALEHRLPVLQPAAPGEDSFMREIARLAPDLIVLVAYGKILPAPLLGLPPLGAINLHPSLLPAYRGAAPIERAVLDGAAFTGVTVIDLAPELDAGDIILQERHPISISETAGELAGRLAAAGALLLERAVQQIAAGEARRTPQEHARASYAPPLRREEERLDWSADALTLYNRIRGLNPKPGAYTTCRGRRLKIWRAKPPRSPGEGQGELPARAAPGTLTALENGRIFAAAGDGALLELLELQPAGKQRLSAVEYYHGYCASGELRLGE